MESEARKAPEVKMILDKNLVEETPEGRLCGVREEKAETQKVSEDFIL